MAEGAWVSSKGKVYNEDQSAWEEGWGNSIIPEPADNDWDGKIPKLTSANSTNNGLGATCDFCTMAASSFLNLGSTDFHPCYLSFDRDATLSNTYGWVSGAENNDSMIITLTSPQRLQWVKFIGFDNGYGQSWQYQRNFNVSYQLAGQSSFTLLANVTITAPNQSQLFTLPVSTTENISAIKIQGTQGSRMMCIIECQIW